MAAGPLPGALPSSSCPPAPGYERKVRVWVWVFTAKSAKSPRASCAAFRQALLVGPFLGVSQRGSFPARFAEGRALSARPSSSVFRCSLAHAAARPHSSSYGTECPQTRARVFLKSLCKSQQRSVRHTDKYGARGAPTASLQGMSSAAPGPAGQGHVFCGSGCPLTGASKEGYHRSESSYEKRARYRISTREGS